MLNSTIKLIRLTIGYTTNAVAQETGYTLGYILKLENSKENISKKLMNSFQTVYDMPLSKIKEISRLEDYGYTRAGIISEISDYPEVLIKLIRIVTGQTLDDVAGIAGITEQKLSALESYDLEITKKDHYNLAKAFDMTNCEMDKLMDNHYLYMEIKTLYLILLFNNIFILFIKQIKYTICTGNRNMQICKYTSNLIEWFCKIFTIT